MLTRAPASTRSNVTIQEVAQAAGVSIGTVSRALRQQPGVSEVTRAQVTRVAQTLGYDMAKLRAGKLRRISFVLHRRNIGAGGNPFYSHVLHGVEDECRARGLTLHFTSLDNGDDVAELMQRNGTDGLLCVGFVEDDLLEQLRALDLPLVLVDLLAPGLPSVNSDNVGGARQAVTHLLTRGRRRVAFIDGPDHPSIRARRLGYRQALYDAGVPADPALEVCAGPEGTTAEVTAAMHALLALPQPPDAVFAFNDASAIGAMYACQAAGLKVPQDLAFVGFDDVSAAAQTAPPLTTLRVNKEALGARGVQLLLERAALAQTELPVELIVRASSGERR
ncbi:LacI family DNA-binding transcriptional regulator [Deinococcus marmoris]|uniref:LacI family DNA-binding transcriptional regulator n=1 Tax=Deinococcus marmoris TaxID=249408 RepID=UPI00096A5918|nr:LacI family DNA-binding transcriptional regulator [Deinococcus marmoris]